MVAPFISTGMDIGSYVDDRYEQRKLQRELRFLQETIEITTKELENRSAEERSETEADVDCFFAHDLLHVECNFNIKNIIADYRHSSIFYPGWERVQKNVSENLTEQQKLLLYSQRREDLIKERLAGQEAHIYFKVAPLLSLHTGLAFLVLYVKPEALTSNEVLEIFFFGNCLGVASHFFVSELMKKCRRGGRGRFIY